MNSADVSMFGTMTISMTRSRLLRIVACNQSANANPEPNFILWKQGPKKRATAILWKTRQDTVSPSKLQGTATATATAIAIIRKTKQKRNMLLFEISMCNNQWRWRISISTFQNISWCKSTMSVCFLFYWIHIWIQK